MCPTRTRVMGCESFNVERSRGFVCPFRDRLGELGEETI
jgi:hypothetical protein